MKRKHGQCIGLAVMKKVGLFLALHTCLAGSIETHDDFLEHRQEVETDGVLSRIVSIIPESSIVFIQNASRYENLNKLLAVRKNIVVINTDQLLSRDYQDRVMRDRYGMRLQNSGNAKSTVSDIMYAIFLQTSYPCYIMLEDMILPWTYEYAQPRGPLVELSKEPCISLQTVKETERAWVEILSVYCATENKAEMVGKELAALRSTVGTVYQYRGLTNEAKCAYRDAVILDPHDRDIALRLIEHTVQSLDIEGAEYLITNLLWSIDRNTARLSQEKLDRLKDRTGGQRTRDGATPTASSASRTNTTPTETAPMP